jgi:hypothetical protein
MSPETAGKAFAIFMCGIAAMVLTALSVGLAFLLVKFVEWCAA